MERLNFSVPEANLFCLIYCLKEIKKSSTSEETSLLKTSVSHINCANIWNFFPLVKTPLSLTPILSKHYKSSFIPIPNTLSLFDSTLLQT